MPPFLSAGADSDPRRLLRALREMMTERMTAQSRLDRFARLIAAHMKVDVCSIYLRRASGVLELFATQGLKPQAVHETRMAPEEGLVGLVARASEPVNLADAPRHPRFSYRPETGEDEMRSFLGVPILRGGRLLGVLVVQGRLVRRFVEDEIEALQTVAMVLAEIVASGELIAENELEEADLRPVGPARLDGAGLAEGIGIGQVVLHAPPVPVLRFIAEDAETENERLEKALGDLRRTIDEMLASADDALSGTPRDVLEAYRLFAYDRGWASRLREAVVSGLTAEAAVERVRNEDKARLTEHPNPYFRERRHDLDDLADRMLRILSDEPAPSEAELPNDAIVVARNLGPADLLAYDLKRVKGVALEGGSAASHLAIVARALDVPVVGRLDGLIDRVLSGDGLVIDGGRGEVHLRPPKDIAEAFAAKAAMRSERLRSYDSLRDVPACTTDGRHISIQANLGLDIDLPAFEASGAEGIGLFRTELQFLVAQRLPRFRAQHALYKKVLDEAGERPVTFRVADLGGDKLLPYLQLEREANPAMGWRALRISLDRPALFRYQLRALLRAAASRTLRVLLPMVTTVSELEAARTHLAREIARARRRGAGAPNKVELGAMIEVPAAVCDIDAILKRVDFVAVGTNDLHQFFFASDRGSARLGQRYDMISRPFLSMLRCIAERATAAGKAASVCGMHAGRPLDALALVGCGYDTLSMPVAAIGPVKQAIRSCRYDKLCEAVAAIIDGDESGGRERLASLAREAGAVTEA